MNSSAHISAVSIDVQGFNHYVAALCLGLSVAIAMVLGSGGAHVEWSGVRIFAVVETVAISHVEPQLPRPASISSVSYYHESHAAEVISGEDVTALQAQEARMVPLRGAPGWVWALPDDDVRKIQAGHDWDIVASADRAAGRVVLAWAMKVIPEEEYWSGICQRWIDDPEWGGIEH